MKEVQKNMRTSLDGTKMKRVCHIQADSRKMVNVSVINVNLSVKPSGRLPAASLAVSSELERCGMVWT